MYVPSLIPHSVQIQSRINVGATLMALLWLALQTGHIYSEQSRGDFTRCFIMKVCSARISVNSALMAYCYCSPDLQDVTKRHSWLTSLSSQKTTWRQFWSS